MVLYWSTAGKIYTLKQWDYIFEKKDKNTVNITHEAKRDNTTRIHGILMKQKGIKYNNLSDRI